jgi:hypothetical protein
MHISIHLFLGSIKAHLGLKVGAKGDFLLCEEDDKASWYHKD